MATARQSKRTASASTSKKRKATVTGQASKTARRAARSVVKSVSAHVLPALPHDAVKLLERDHRRFEKLLEEGEETTARASKRRRSVLHTLAAEIAAHERKEEKVLYPALKTHPEAKDIVLESFQEHHVADVIVAELQRLDVSNEQWGAKFKVLKENIEHHIQEEEGPMWRTARGVLSQDELRQLGARMARMKADAR